MIGITPRGQVCYVSGTFGETASDRHTIERSTLLTDDMFSQSWQVWKLWSNIYFSKDVKVITPT